MIVSNPARLEPYGFDMYVMSTENQDEEKDILNLFSKYSKKIKIKESFQHDDGRKFESAFAWDWSGKYLTGCIYIHLKRINEEALDHELIHALNCVNENYAVSTKGEHDESVACFFTYMKREVLKLLKENKIKIIRNRIRLVKNNTVKITEESKL